MVFIHYKFVLTSIFSFLILHLGVEAIEQSLAVQDQPHSFLWHYTHTQVHHGHIFAVVSCLLCHFERRLDFHSLQRGQVQVTKEGVGKDL